MFLFARNYPMYEAPLTGTAVSPPMKQYVPKAWAGESGSVFEANTAAGETTDSYNRWEKTSSKFFEMFKWLYEYMGESDKEGEGATPDENRSEINKDTHQTIRHYLGKDLLAIAANKSGSKYKNLSGEDVRTSLGYDVEVNDYPDLDTSDPFGFMNGVRNNSTQTNNEDGAALRSSTTDNAHYQRMISIGGAQSGIPNIRNDANLVDSNEDIMLMEHDPDFPDDPTKYRIINDTNEFGEISPDTWQPTEGNEKIRMDISQVARSVASPEYIGKVTVTVTPTKSSRAHVVETNAQLSREALIGFYNTGQYETTSTDGTTTTTTTSYWNPQTIIIGRDRITAELFPPADNAALEKIFDNFSGTGPLIFKDRAEALINKADSGFTQEQKDALLVRLRKPNNFTERAFTDSAVVKEKARLLYKAIRDNIRTSDWVNGLHVSTFEAAANFKLTPLITQFEDPSEMIPLVHPTDTNFAEEFMMGLWKDDRWEDSSGIQKYSKMPTFTSYSSIPSRSTEGAIHDFYNEGTAASDSGQFYIPNGETTIHYKPIGADLVNAANDIDTGFSSSLITDTIKYEDGLQEFIDNIKTADDGSGKIVWKNSEISTNPYKYLIDNANYTYAAYIGSESDLTDGKFDKAKQALKTINFAQKMFYSMLMISSGIFDLVGGWDYAPNNIPNIGKIRNNKEITDSWSKKDGNQRGELAEGISDFHMSILSQLTSYIHPVTYAMALMTGASLNPNLRDGAHNGYLFETMENGVMVKKDFKQLFAQAYTDFTNVLDKSDTANQAMKHIYHKSLDLNATLFGGTDSNSITQTSFFSRNWATYGQDFGRDDRIAMIKEGVGHDAVTSEHVDYKGTSHDNPFWHGTATAPTKTVTWNQWYATSFEYMRDRSFGNIWNFLQSAKISSNYARAKSEYKTAKLQTEMMEENDKESNNAVMEKRRAEAEAGARAMEAKRKSFEALMKSFGSKNKKKA